MIDASGPNAGRSVRYSAERREHAFDVDRRAFSRGLESLLVTAPAAAPATALSDLALRQKLGDGSYLLESSALAPRMQAHERRVSLYLPLRLYVDDLDPGRTLVTYDLPSATFAQFASPEVDAFAALLDAKLYALVLDAAELAGRDLRE